MYSTVVKHETRISEVLYLIHPNCLAEMSLAGGNDYEAVHIPCSSPVDWYLVGFWICAEISRMLKNFNFLKGFSYFLLTTDDKIRLF